ncbi:14587_t:CDS:2 [Dentiscutata heterogama]|uniref:14587_t:CDS:1 n=1 Tax=Dentiscutata heterogama TaxID=1316150 RepID=A0ACA9MY21_9GLOM|nr:14587_t:CDS:2 [Dentiscutata heterogama]
MVNFLIALIVLMVSLSEAATYSNNFKRADICTNVFLSAVHNKDIKGDITFYQDSKGAVWITGTYQWGFQSPETWTYDWTIQNGCRNVIFNITPYLHTEYAMNSDCNGYPSDNKKLSYKNRGLLYKRIDKVDTCEIGGWGTKPWVVKVEGLTWDCNNEGFKHQTCDQDFYQDNFTCDNSPGRLSGQGSGTGTYLVINGESNSGSSSITSSAAIAIVNGEGIYKKLSNNQTSAMGEPSGTQQQNKATVTQQQQNPKETQQEQKPKETQQEQKPNETQQEQKPKETQQVQKPKETQQVQKPKETQQVQKPKETQKEQNSPQKPSVAQGQQPQKTT